MKILVLLMCCCGLWNLPGAMVQSQPPVGTPVVPPSVIKETLSKADRLFEERMWKEASRIYSDHKEVTRAKALFESACADGLGEGCAELEKIK